MTPPPAFLALWNGVTPERRAEYEAWHGVEHMPERLGAPGFLAARRYRAEGGDDYFTLYELESLAALETPAYHALMHEPTAWSLRMRQAMTGFRRLPCRTALGHRGGQGGALATLRIASAAPAALAALRVILEDALERAILTGLLLGGSDAEGEPYPVFPDAPPPRVESLLVLEGTEPGGVMALALACQGLLPGEEAPRGWRLLQALRREELSDPFLPRQPPKDALRRIWAATPSPR